MHGDMRPLEVGALQVVRRPKTKDADATVDERDFLYIDMSKLEPGQYSRESGCRAFWYIFQSILEDEQVQRRGLIVVAYLAHFSNKNRDPTFARMCIGMMQGCLPIQMSGFHVCYAPPLFRLAARVLFLFMSERLRKRIVSHNNSSGSSGNCCCEQVNSLLGSKYGIPRRLLPTDMGGELKLDIRTWLAERHAAGL